MVRTPAAAECASKGAAGLARAVDALQKLPNIDTRYIAVMAWQHSNSLEPLLTRTSQPTPPAFAAGGVFNPDCAVEQYNGFAVSTLIVAGGYEADADTKRCATLMRRSQAGRAPVTNRIYPRAALGFDQRAVVAGTQAVARSGQVRHNARALAGAQQDVREFLSHHLFPSKRAAAEIDAPAGAQWIIEPSAPGPDLPPRGRSLFDHVGDGGADIPYPFEALLARLKSHAGPSHYGRPAVKQALFPLGRSLQRQANALDFFGSPRMVVAIDTEPALGSALPNLKDRLFLGFQPRANVIEAISWNPRAGRFEFQIIRNYGPGMTPKLGYAPRAVCTGCHQNQGPIFALAPWTETNSTPRITHRLHSLHKRFTASASTS